MLKQSRLSEVQQDAKPVSAYKRETITCPMTCTRARAWKSVGLFRQRNKRYREIIKLS